MKWDLEHIKKCRPLGKQYQAFGNGTRFVPSADLVQIRFALGAKNKSSVHWRSGDKSSECWISEKISWCVRVAVSNAPTRNLWLTHGTCIELQYERNTALRDCMGSARGSRSLCQARREWDSQTPLDTAVSSQSRDCKIATTSREAGQTSFVINDSRARRVGSVQIRRVLSTIHDRRHASKWQHELIRHVILQRSIKVRSHTERRTTARSNDSFSPTCRRRRVWDHLQRRAQYCLPASRHETRIGREENTVSRCLLALVSLRAVRWSV